MCSVFRRFMHFTLVAILWSIQSGYAQGPLPKAQESTETLYQELFGLPVRLGFYLQGASQLIAFANLKKYPFAPPLTSTVLSFNSLISWFLRMRVQENTLFEAWISLALALSLTVPGSWLLYSAFIVTRAEQGWRIGRIPGQREIVHGKGLPISLTVLSTGCSVIAYAYYWFEEARSVPHGNTIWVFGLGQINSVWVHGWMYTHGALLPLNLPLLVWTFSAWCLSVITYESPLKRKGNILWQSLIRDGATVAGLKHIKRNLSKIYTFALAIGVILGVYWALLVASIEFTIKGAGLPPLTSFEQPGQLIPLLAGSLSFVTAIGSILRREDPSNLYIPPQIPNIQSRIPSTTLGNTS